MADTKNNNFTENAFVNSLVGQGTRFSGELDLNGLLRIDGDFIGKIRTTGKVLVGESGRAECSIQSGIVVVGGVVKGDIYASEKTIILSSGIVIGNIFTPRLIVEEGVILEGNCRVQLGEIPDIVKESLPENGEEIPEKERGAEETPAVKTFSGNSVLKENIDIDG